MSEQLSNNEKPSATFLASFPPIQGAIRVGQDGMRIALDIPETDILDLALFFSQLLDIDLLPEECIPIAFEAAVEQIEELKGLHAEDNLYNASWTRAEAQDTVRDCSHEHSERRQREQEGMREEERAAERESERRRAAERQERLSESIGEQYKMTKTLISKSPMAGCTRNAYRLLSNADDSNQDMTQTCSRLSLNDTPEFCQESKGIRTAIEEAAKELVAKCPPVPIINHIEAKVPSDVIGHALADIMFACSIAEDDECMKEIQRATQREKEKTSARFLF